MLGDLVAQALATVGITEEWVTRRFGRCCCRERRDKLNSLDAWARRMLLGRTEDAADHLERIVRD